MIEKICVICGNRFVAGSQNSKYCCSECRAEGAKLTRRAWEDKTGYKEKQKLLMREKRGKQRKEDIEQKQKEKEERKRLNTERNNNRAKQIKMDAAAGDPIARMLMVDKYSKDYWIAFQDYELQMEKEYKRKSSKTVNGISIYDDDFADNVILSIRNIGKIVINTVYQE